MLNDRERRALATIEQQLAASDPDFVQIFRSPAHGSGGLLLPRVLTVLGLLLVVVGSATVAAPVAALGLAVSLASLVLAGQRSGGSGLNPAT